MVDFIALLIFVYEVYTVTLMLRRIFDGTYSIESDCFEGYVLGYLGYVVLAPILIPIYEYQDWKNDSVP